MSQHGKLRQVIGIVLIAVLIVVAYYYFVGQGTATTETVIENEAAKLEVDTGEKSGS